MSKVACNVNTQHNAAVKGKGQSIVSDKNRALSQCCSEGERPVHSVGQKQGSLHNAAVKGKGQSIVSDKNRALLCSGGWRGEWLTSECCQINCTQKIFLPG